MGKRISCLALSVVFAVGITVQQASAVEPSAALEQPTSSEVPAFVEPSAPDETAAPEQPAPDEAPAADVPPAPEDEVPESNVPEDDVPEDDVPEDQTPPAPAEEDAAGAPEQAPGPQGPSLLVDGTVVEDAAMCVYGQTTYVSLRSVVQALRPDATVAWAGDHAAVTAEGLDITVYPGKPYLVANGRYLYMPGGARFENGNTLLPVRPLAKALDAQVQWNAEDGNTYLTSGTGAILSGEEFYSADALYWMSHIIYIESGNQPLEGKIAVGNVIQNRVRDPAFPNTIYEVLTQPNQFSSVYSSAMKREPNAESVIAAKLCLDGAVVLPTALWFNRAGVPCWASKHKTVVATIGAHAFYA